jgi:hypothetical protein
MTRVLEMCPELVEGAQKRHSGAGALMAAILAERTREALLTWPWPATANVAGRGNAFEFRLPLTSAARRSQHEIPENVTPDELAFLESGVNRVMKADLG